MILVLGKRADGLYHDLNINWLRRPSEDITRKHWSALEQNLIINASPLHLFLKSQASMSSENFVECQYSLDNSLTIAQYAYLKLIFATIKFPNEMQIQYFSAYSNSRKNYLN
jgi:hypothetical protein